MHSQPSKPYVLRPLILGVLGAMLIYAGISGLTTGSLLYGRHHPVTLTPAHDPTAFWFGIVATCGFGVGAVCMALLDLWSLYRYYTGGSAVAKSSPNQEPAGEPSAETPLKRAFAAARVERNIDLVLPVLKGAVLYVVVGSEPRPGQRPEWFITGSPKPDRSCVTAAESEAALASIRWPKIKLTGAELLQLLPAGIEIIILYAGAGADYLSREQLDWYRQSTT
jgi:hypothetical protein